MHCSSRSMTTMRPAPERSASTGRGHWALVLIAAVGVVGCGAEVAGGAAVVGGLQAEQAKQAQAQQAQAVEKLKACLLYTSRCV